MIGLPLHSATETDLLLHALDCQITGIEQMLARQQIKDDLEWLSKVQAKLTKAKELHQRLYAIKLNVPSITIDCEGTLVPEPKDENKAAETTYVDTISPATEPTGGQPQPNVGGESSNS